MKILAIRGENLASLREFELDFREGPLGRAGLFAITGPTGAGKSTLLDALCVALFNQTPRLGSTAGDVAIGAAGEDPKTRIGASDVRSLLRRGAGTGFAEVDFRGRDTHIYRARWEVRRARRSPRGRLQAQDVSLVDLTENRVLSGTRTETLAEIEDRLGLSFEQFRRSALLAQGEFAAFLHADSRQRSELLERMTGTEIYSRLSRAAFERAKEQTSRRKAIEGAIESYAVLPDAARHELEELYATLEVQSGERQAERERIGAQIEWYRQRAEAEEVLAAALARESEAEQQVATLEPVRAELELARAVREHRPLLDAHRERAASLERIESEERGAREALAQLDREIEQAAIDGRRLERELAEARRRYRESLARRIEVEESRGQCARDWLREHADVVGSAMVFSGPAPREAEFFAGAEVEALLAELAADDADLERGAAALDELRRERVELAEEREAAVRSAEIALRSAREAVDSARAIADRQRERADALDLPALRRGREAQFERRELLRSARDRATAAAALAAEIAALEDRQRERCERLESLRSAQESGERGRLELAIRIDEAEGALARAQLAGSLEQHRAALEPGHPCPLCGSDEHPWASGAAEPARLAREESERVAELRSQAARVQADVLTRAREIEEIEAGNTADGARQAECLGALESARTEFAAAIRELGEFEGLDDPTAVATAEQIDTRLSSLDEALREQGALIAEAEAVEREAATAEGLVRTRASELEDVRQVQEQSTRVAREARRSLLAVDAARVGIRRRMEMQAASALAELRARLEGAEEVRLPEGAALEAGRQRQVELGARRAGVVTRIDELGSVLEAERGAVGEARRRYLAICEELGVSEERFAELAACDAEWLRRREKRLAAAAEELSQARGRSAECRERIRAAEEKGAPEETLEVLSRRADAVAQQTSELAAKLAEVQARLRDDDGARERRAQLGDSLAVATEVERTYAAISELIGSADGKKFRVYAQSLTLDALLGGANRHLEELAPRYQLERVPNAAGRDLEIQVIDRDLGNEIRSVKSLSGGESFLVSLALALALSALSARDTPVESLLIDEGFGSLDQETLESALSALDALQASGRKVGLISHVPGLAERIGTQVLVSPRGGGTSDVSVAGPAL